uniref:Uncharacterized protein n=1 Tax=Plectus sambesii TaxID=2011161 RepID=A0A914WQM8_9BILA
MHAPTTTIETVTVVRPLKVISLICLVLALLLLIVCLATTYWLKTGGFRTGLFEECTDREQTSTPLPSAPRPGECNSANRSRGE